MSEHGAKWLCPCGGRLWTKDELLAEGDEMATYIAEAYLCPDTAFCDEEDDVVPRKYWQSVPDAGRERKDEQG